MRRLRLLILFALVVSSLVFGVSAAAQPLVAATPDCIWVVDTVGRAPTFFWEIDAASSMDAWIVGSEPDPDPDELYRPAIHHWDGTSWSRTVVPRQGRLSAVDARTADDAWAVGFVGTRGRILEQLYEHWDGARWTVVPPAERRRGVVEDVVSVSSDDAWAVGWYRQGPVIRVWHWDGSVWSRAAAPKLPGRLLSVDMRNGHLIATGFASSAIDPQVEVGLILKGPDPWRRVPIDGRTDQVGVLTDVSGTWATGGRPGENWTVHRTLLGWTSIPFGPDLEGGIDTVADLGSQEAWAFGQHVPSEGIDEPSTWGIFRWDGTSWTGQPAPPGYQDAPGFLVDSAVAPGGAMFVVGQTTDGSGSRSVVLSGC
jgi:hypothetical protein